jgi:hypothetical protein
MMDRAIRSGPDVARTLASGTHFAFLGRTCKYSVAALGDDGGNHAISIKNTIATENGAGLFCTGKRFDEACYLNYHLKHFLNRYKYGNQLLYLY